MVANDGINRQFVKQGRERLVELQGVGFNWPAVFMDLGDDIAGMNDKIQVVGSHYLDKRFGSRIAEAGVAENTGPQRFMTGCGLETNASPGFTQISWLLEGSTSIP